MTCEVAYYHVNVFQVTAFKSTQITVVYNVYFAMSQIFLLYH